MPKELSDLLAHVERTNAADPPGSDVPNSLAELEAAGIPTWAVFPSSWPDPWAARFAEIQKLPADQAGPAERVLQSQFLRALDTVPRGLRGDKMRMPG